MTTLDPRVAEATAANDRGAALLQAGDLAAATVQLARACALAPGWFLPHFNLAHVHLAASDEEAAIEALQQCLAREPRFGRAHFELATLRLAQGDFERGWPAYDWRFDHGGHVPPRDGYPAPVWDGTPFPGRRLIIWGEQGFGDHLQFARFLSAAADRGGDTAVWVPAPLRRLFASSWPEIEVLEQEPAPTTTDLQIPLLSLPRLFATTADDLPGPMPYLRPRPSHGPTDLPDASPRDRRRIGLVWRSGTGYPGHERRNLDLDRLAPLAARDGLACYALQFDVRDDERRQLATLGVTDLSQAMGDFARSAAIVRHLDLVITVDTAMAHLVGGLGLPVWILLPHAADWRWLRGRTDSPWYPTMRLFRQPTLDGWSTVIDQVIDALTVDHERRTCPFEAVRESAASPQTATEHQVEAIDTALGPPVAEQQGAE